MSKIKDLTGQRFGRLTVLTHCGSDGNGQLNKCSYIHFITKGTVEEHIYKALFGYSDFSEKLFTEYMSNFTRSYNQ